MPKTRDIDPAEIQMSSGNPREIFDEEDLAKLRESIDEVGILVPLTVYESDGEIRLIDGERRLRCALELGLKKGVLTRICARFWEVPVHRDSAVVTA